MSGIVLALGNAVNHVRLIKKELDPYFGEVNVLKFNSFSKFNEARIRKECKRHGASIVAYVLPTDGQPVDEVDCCTTRDYWKRMAEGFCPSHSIKELELVSYACGNGQFWIDGIDQFQASSREPVFAF